ncbi:Hypp656 [Branchiostoma lanceolatum]|nr:Hypp656 [Branchiostoma lanceolatum]
MADPQPKPLGAQVVPVQMLFRQNQLETGLGGAQDEYNRRAQQGMQFRLPGAGGMQGSVQYRPQLQYQEHFSCQHAAWNAMTTSGPEESFMSISGEPSIEQNAHGNSSQWEQQACLNPLQSRIPQNGKSGWNVRSQECRRFPHTVFGAAAARNGSYSGTFGALPAPHHKQYRGATADRRVPSAGSGASSRHTCRRRKRPSAEDEGPSSKMFLSEEKMAAHLNKLSISNDHTYVGMARKSTTQDKNHVVIEDLSDDSSDECASSSDSDVGSTIQISPELQQGMQQVAGERLLPEGLFEQLNRPCMDVVLWKPPGDFVRSVISSASSPKQHSTPTAVHSEPLLLTRDSPSPSPVTCNHGVTGGMIDTKVVDHASQPTVTMFDSVDDDMEL